MEARKIDGVTKLVRDIVYLVVDDGDSVSTTMVSNGDRDITIFIDCNVKDVGRIIGLSGKNIKSIRTIIFSMGKRLGYTISLVINQDKLKSLVN